MSKSKTYEEFTDITNLEDFRFRTAPDLCKAIQDAVKKSSPNPDNVIITTRIAPQEYIKVPTLWEFSEKERKIIEKLNK